MENKTKVQMRKNVKKSFNKNDENKIMKVIMQ